MTVDKLRSVFQFYQNWIKDNFAIHPNESPGYASHTGHLAWMCETAINELIPAGRIEKAMRWLGFIQGCLLSRAHFNLEDLKSHSRSAPTEEERLSYNTHRE